MFEGIVFHSAKRVFHCQIISAEKRMVTATALATLIKGSKNHIVVGDRVSLRPTSTNVSEQNEFEIFEVHPRKNEISRFIPRESLTKTIAANCDLMAITVSISLPLYKKGIVDRYLVRSAQWKVPAIVIFNKMDESTVSLDFEQDRLKNLNIPCFFVSAKYPEQYPLEELKKYLKDKTAIFIGQSGVGKSKLISALTDFKINLKDQNLGKANKGAHTTTWAEMIDCYDFNLIDSPGIRSFSLDDITEEDLLLYFPDIAEYITKCKFANCTHFEDAKGCFFNGLDPELRSTQLILDRLDSYLRLNEEVSNKKPWEK